MNDHQQQEISLAKGNGVCNERKKKKKTQGERSSHTHLLPLT